MKWRFDFILANGRIVRYMLRKFSEDGSVCLDDIADFRFQVAACRHLGSQKTQFLSLFICRLQALKFPSKFDSERPNISTFITAYNLLLKFLRWKVLMGGGKGTVLPI